MTAHRIEPRDAVSLSDTKVVVWSSQSIEQLSRFAKLEFSQSERRTAFHSSGFQLRLAYLQKTFWPFYSGPPDHLRCLGHAGNRSHCGTTVWHSVVGRGALSIPDLRSWHGSWLSQNMPRLICWARATVCRHLCAFDLGS